MSPHTNTPTLLRRITQLEAMVAHLSDDFAGLRSELQQQRLPSPKPQRGRSRAVQAENTRTQTKAPPIQPNGGGLAAATVRGEAARVQWLRDGLIVPGEHLAQAWGLTRQALAPAAGRGEVFAVKVGNRLYYPKSFLTLDRATVATICRALGDLSASEKLMFWLREHGSLAAQSVAAALDAGTPVTKVERLAAAWAKERGAGRVNETA
jgi:hypothetical protein